MCSNTTHPNTALTVCLLMTLCPQRYIWKLNAPDTYFKSLLLWGSVTQVGRIQEEFCRAMYLSSRCIKENTPHRRYILTRLHLTTVLRKSKFPEILRKWGHLECTRRNWGNKAKMMRRFQMEQSINKCNTQWPLKRECVLADGVPGGRSEGTRKSPAQTSTHGARDKTFFHTRVTKSSRGHRRMIDEAPLATGGAIGTLRFKKKSRREGL